MTRGALELDKLQTWEHYSYGAVRGHPAGAYDLRDVRAGPVDPDRGGAEPAKLSRAASESYDNGVVYTAYRPQGGSA